MSIIIFDWDDTLFPQTDYKNFKDINKNFHHFNEMISKRVSHIEQEVINILTKAKKTCIVYIVTNAMKTWISPWCGQYYKKLKFDNITVISAHDLYSQAYPNELKLWKKKVYQTIIETHPQLKQIIHISDSTLDKDAISEAISEHNKRFDDVLITYPPQLSPSFNADPIRSDIFPSKIILKTIKLKDEPTLEEVYRQLQLISNSFDNIVIQPTAFDIVTRISYNHYKVAIIGSGIAAYSAALMLDVYKHQTVIFRDPANKYCHQVASPKITNYPGIVHPISGIEFYTTLEKQVKSANSVKIIDEVVESIDHKKAPYTLKTNKSIYSADIILIATGLVHNDITVPVPVTVPVTGINKGVYNCIICDHPKMVSDGLTNLEGKLDFKGLHVSIIGNGDNSNETALIISESAATVNIISRTDKSKASVILQDQLKEKKNITIYNNFEVIMTVYTLKQSVKQLTDILIRNSSGNDSMLKTDVIIKAVGHVPNTQFLKNSDIILDKDGYVQTNINTTETNIKNIFATGACSNRKYNTTVATIGHGNMAAVDINERIMFMNKDKIL